LVQGAGPRLETLLAELTTTSRRMTELLEALEASPQILLFGRGAPPPGPGEAGYPTSSPARE
jgi:phospholipid/cholesterol/gamma-HCH transport system substrate-binding protein